MDKRTVLDAIDRFVRTLEAKGTRVDQAILFGSYATGRFHDGSDIDLVVLSRDFADKDLWERVEILADAIYEVWEPIEAVPMTPEEWERGDSMVVEFARDGELVYGSKT